ncbi:hypothetical protein HPB48_022474 [Haemaphysalis longicornis]|uniref:ABC transmembrane type-1 domain-containing protein n=1 Tax=Haemaphysalis longicornis TaxID=44386 RepID=A0A9J6FEI3_HAELO|nr:hypothetical protein HPB48_022474 [Haemaphysalis longicornis]
MSIGLKSCFPAGYITSMLGVDCSVLCTSAITIPTPVFGLAFLPLIFWMLASRAGIGPSVCCASWLVLVLSLPYWSSFIQKRLWAKATSARDERLKITTDLLSTIRVVKMYAWEDAMQENVVRAREKELHWLLRINLLDAVLDAVYSSTSSVVKSPGRVQSTKERREKVGWTDISPVALANEKEFPPLKPSPSPYPATMNQNTETRKECELHEVQQFKCPGPNNTFEAATIRALNIGVISISVFTGAVVMQKCSFAWSPPFNGKTEAQMADVELDIAPGSLVGVVGFIGSGKSSLLAAILGDMYRIKGA